MNIILIVADTLRKDHLGCYGNDRIVTPHLDSFAEQCTVFSGAYATSFPTMCARADFFTGKHTFTYLGWSPLTGEDKVLAEMMRDAGYTTLAAVDTPFHMRNGFGYDRGFKDFVFVSGQLWGFDGGRVTSRWRSEEDRFCARTFAEAEKLLEHYHREKFFLYVDTWDPHEPWQAPDYYTRLYRPEYNGEDHVNPTYSDYKGILSEDDVALCHDCYCGEITMVDRWVGMFLDKVKKLGIWEDTAIIFMSDHGFCFGEHGLLGKARFSNPTRTLFKEYYRAEVWEAYRKQALAGESQWIWSPLYEEIVRVPLLVYVPGIKPATSEAVVNAVDIMPSILEMAGAAIPDSVEGKSIVPLINQHQDNAGDFAVSSYPLFAKGQKTRIVDGGLRNVRDVMPITVSTKEWSMFYTDNETPVELYDLKRDPGQANNVYDYNKEVARELHGKLLRRLADSQTDGSYIEARSKLP